MPTYEYRCQDCHYDFETWQKMTDDPLTICPECGGHIRRVLYPAGIVFKGHGFYKTDHGSGALASGDKKAEGASSESKAESSSAESASANNAAEKKSSESKPPASVAAD